MSTIGPVHSSNDESASQSTLQPEKSSNDTSHAVWHIINSTRDQFARMGSYGNALSRLWRARKKLEQQKFQLGQAAFDAGIGDEQLRNDICELNRRIEDATNHHKRTGKMTRERGRLIMDLSRRVIANENQRSSLKEQFESIGQSIQTEKNCREVVKQKQQSLFPKDRREWRYLLSGVGVLTSFILIIGLLLTQTEAIIGPFRGPSDNSSFGQRDLIENRGPSTTQLAGQFLIDPSEFLGWFNAPGIASVAVMFWMLAKLRRNVLLKLVPDVSLETFSKGVGISGIVSIALTFVLYSSSLNFLAHVQELTGYHLDRARADIASIKHSDSSSTKSNEKSFFAVGRGVQIASKNKNAFAALVAAVLLFVIGAGYAFTILQLPLWLSIIVWTAGVGLSEELSKAFAGLFICYYAFDIKSMSTEHFQRVVLAAFAIAGLGFGAIEAFKYFGMYYENDASIYDYALRAIGLVTLHGAWSAIVGNIVATRLPHSREQLANKKVDTFLLLVIASIPSAVAHGLYDSLCFNGYSWLALVVGAMSIYVAGGLIWQNQEKLGNTSGAGLSLAHVNSTN